MTWLTDKQNIVSRSVESELVDVEQRPMPSLYHINLQTNKQRKITSPTSKEGDFRPINFRKGKKLIWIRTNREKASVLVADTDGLNQKILIKKIDMGTWYYEHWNWDEVFSLY